MVKTNPPPSIVDIRNKFKNIFQTVTNDQASNTDPFGQHDTTDLFGQHDTNVRAWNTFHKSLVDQHEQGTKFYVGDALLAFLDTKNTLNFQSLLFDSLNLQNANIGGLQLNHAVIDGVFKCHHMTVKNSCSFQHTRLNGDLYCNFVTFSGRASFWESRFSGVAQFVQTTFEERVDFTKARLQQSEFQSTQFHKTASFENTFFLGPTTFNSCDFRGDAVFRDTRSNRDDPVGFLENASFGESRFWGRAEFADITMKDVSFMRVQFNREGLFSMLDLADTSFLFVDLSHNLRFYNVQWERTGNRLTLKDESKSEVLPDETQRLEAVLKHYGELVNYYDGVRDAERSEGFFLSEMTVRSKLARIYEKPVFFLYGATSHFGTSWARACLVLLIWLFIFCPLQLYLVTDLHGYASASQLTFKLLMLHKDAYAGIQTEFVFFVHAWIQLTLLGQVALLFLAIRRRFRRGGTPA